MKLRNLLPVVVLAALTSNAFAVPAGTPAPSVSVNGTFSNGDMVVGGPGPNQIQDSGVQPTKSNATTRDPTSTDDSTQGYAVGSIWLNASTSYLWTATSVSPGAATWTSYYPVGGVPASTPFGWVFSVPANTSYFTVPGSGGANQNYEAMAPTGGSLSNLQVHVANAPGTGNSDTITLYVGAPTSMTATGITCTVAGASNSCSDTAHTAAIAAGEAWAVQVTTSASAPATGASSVGVLYSTKQ